MRVYFFVYKNRLRVYVIRTHVHKNVYIAFTNKFTCIQICIRTGVKRCVQVCNRCIRMCVQRLHIVYNFTLSFFLISIIDESIKLLYSYTREVRYISSLTSKLIE